MGTTAEELKQLYSNLGGDDSKTAKTQTPVEVLKKIYEYLGGTNPNAKDVQQTGDILNKFNEMDIKLSVDGKLYPPLIEKVTGNPVVFDDGTDSPLVECVATVEASRDLHGYPFPWVGGAGKNLLSSDRTFLINENVSGTWTGDTYVRNGVTFEVEYNDTGYPIKITANGTNTSTGSFVFVTARNLFTLDTNYIINGLQNGSMDTGRINIQGLSNYLGGDNLITGDGETHRIGLQISGSATVNNVVWYPMLRYATVTDPTFAPYENICPITGMSEVNIDRCGKNLCDKNDFNHTSTLTYKPMFVGDGMFTMSTNCPPTGGGQENYRDIFFLPGNVNSGASSSINGVIDSTPITCESIDGYVTVASRYNTVRNDPLNYDWQIEKGSVPTTYEPYKGHTYTIDLDGTRYSGTVDVLRGKMRLTHVTEIYDGSNDEDWYKSSTYDGSFYLKAVSLPDRKADSVFMCNLAEYVEPSNFAYGTCCGTSGSKAVNFWLMPAGSDVESWRTYLTSNNLQIVYELATPIEIDLTLTAIRSLEGSNYISADAKELSIKYINNKWNIFNPTVEVSRTKSASKRKVLLHVPIEDQEPENYEFKEEEKPVEDIPNKDEKLVEKK